MVKKYYIIIFCICVWWYQKRSTLYFQHKKKPRSIYHYDMKSVSSWHPEYPTKELKTRRQAWYCCTCVLLTFATTNTYAHRDVLRWELAKSFIVIEFQKRGLPHAHILLTLNQEYAITEEEISKYVSDEISHIETPQDYKVYNM